MSDPESLIEDARIERAERRARKEHTRRWSRVNSATLEPPECPPGCPICEEDD